MKKHLRIISIISAAIMLCGCTRIPDYSASSDESSSESESNEPQYDSDGNELPVKEFEVVKRDYIVKLNAEGGSHNGTEKTDGEFDGRAYISLKKGNGLIHIASVNTAQHYRIVLSARSADGAAVTLTLGNKICGAFYIPPYVSSPNDETEYGSSDTSDTDTFSFDYYGVDNVYLASGQSILKFNVGSGSADIDYILIESSDAVSDQCYDTGTACANPTASLTTVGVMKYLSDVFGKKVLTAQNTTFSYNAEIEAVYAATGRYPAIRTCEMADEFLDEEKSENEIKLAEEWKNGGGLASYVWHWYSPNEVHGISPRSMDTEDLFGNQLPDQLALLNEDDFDRLITSGLITSDIKLLAKDIDKAAEFLSKLNEKDITVLFEPMPDPDSGLYWWGSSAESYKKLWQFMFTRLCTKHSLKNLIWIWNASDTDYYPGDKYIDIIGQSFYEKSNNSFAGRFTALSESTPARKMLCVTSCDVLPSIDYMSRDNAFWLWTAAGSGSGTIKADGTLDETFNKTDYLKYFYNTEVAATRDELPDFSKYLYGE